MYFKNLHVYNLLDTLIQVRSTPDNNVYLKEAE